eukprot:1752795-Amphidinium_carterae.2
MNKVNYPPRLPRPEPLETPTGPPMSRGPITTGTGVAGNPPIDPRGPPNNTTAIQSGHFPNGPPGGHECCGCQSRHGSLPQCALCSHPVCPLRILHSADEDGSPILVCPHHTGFLGSPILFYVDNVEKNELAYQQADEEGDHEPSSLQQTIQYHLDRIEHRNPRIRELMGESSSLNEERLRS